MVRTARGPNRAPGRFDTPRSIGTPTAATSSAYGSVGSGQVEKRRNARIRGPALPVGRLDGRGRATQRRVCRVEDITVRVARPQGLKLGFVHDDGDSS